MGKAYGLGYQDIVRLYEKIYFQLAIFHSQYVYVFSIPVALPQSKVLLINEGDDLERRGRILTELLFFFSYLAEPDNSKIMINNNLSVCLSLSLSFLISLLAFVINSLLFFLILDTIYLSQPIFPYISKRKQKSINWVFCFCFEQDY